MVVFQWTLLTGLHGVTLKAPCVSGPSGADSIVCAADMDILFKKPLHRIFSRVLISLAILFKMMCLSSKVRCKFAFVFLSDISGTRFSLRQSQICWLKQRAGEISTIILEEVCERLNFTSTLGSGIYFFTSAIKLIALISGANLYKHEVIYYNILILINFFQSYRRSRYDFL